MLDLCLPGAFRLEANVNCERAELKAWECAAAGVGRRLILLLRIPRRGWAFGPTATRAELYKPNSFVVMTRIAIFGTLIVAVPSASIETASAR